MKAYAAIGHFKENENLTSVAIAADTKKSFIRCCRSNAFVPYVVITEQMLCKLAELDGIDLFEQVQKMTTNHHIWNDVTEYIEQCWDILADKMAAARNN